MFEFLLPLGAVSVFGVIAIACAQPRPQALRVRVKSAERRTLHTRLRGRR